jgi:endonuclease YncB( thermonuclease family)
MAHDFKNFPELTNSQMQFYYFDSPHQQITENFKAKVTKVIDGDTIKVRTDFRDFDFKIRMAKIAAPEKTEEGGIEAQKHLESLILNEDVDVVINKNNRVGKWGRLIGEIILFGMNINYEMVDSQLAIRWDERTKIPQLDIDLILGGFEV